MSKASELVARLEADLEAARTLVEFEKDAGGEISGSGIDTSGMPGGVDSAPVSTEVTEPKGLHPDATIPVGEPPSIGVDLEDVGIDIIQDLKAGRRVSDVASMLLGPTGLHSIVKAIGQLAREVGI